jgi:hypothetical protein
VLLGTGHLRLVDYLAVAAPERGRRRAALDRSSATAGAWLGSDPPLERWADALIRELAPDSVRLEGAAGAFLLTASEDGSYTAPFV